MQANTVDWHANLALSSYCQSINAFSLSKMQFYRLQLSLAVVVVVGGGLFMAVVVNGRSTFSMIFSAQNVEPRSIIHQIHILANGAINVERLDTKWYAINWYNNDRGLWHSIETKFLWQNRKSIGSSDVLNCECSTMSSLSSFRCGSVILLVLTISDIFFGYLNAFSVIWTPFQWFERFFSHLNACSAIWTDYKHFGRSRQSGRSLGPAF